MRHKIKELLQFHIEEATSPIVEVKGWIRTKRISKQVVFLTINDGTCQENLQIVLSPHKLTETLLGQLNTGASVAVVGKLIASQGQKQGTELQGITITLLGSAADYPLQPKAHSLEFLRTLPHLRFRTNTFGAIFRIRHVVCYAIHRFFHKRGFVYLHTPIITATDAEGAGELFHVTSLDTPFRHPDGCIDTTKELLKEATNLTVSGQLAAEAAAMGLGAVYTFGPTFRAENSHTSRHLAEFWMVEPEVAFDDLTDSIILAESLLKELVQEVLAHCVEDLTWLQQRSTLHNTNGLYPKMPLLDRLAYIGTQPFVRITYTEAIAILLNAAPNKNGTFIYPVTGWGSDLKSEHERYLVAYNDNKPIVITDYPRTIKAFYMRQNDDDRTVAAMDILFPGIGEIIGGSQREERMDCLKEAIQRMHISLKDLDWYLDTRRFGTIPHSGFGLGIERLMLFITGMENIRDVIPFPRTPGNVLC